MTAGELSDELEMLVTNVLVENHLPDTHVFTKIDLDMIRRIVDRILRRAETELAAK